MCCTIVNTLTQEDKINLDKASVECQNHDLGTDQRFAEFRDSVYNELIEWLRSSVAATLVAVFLAFVGLALMLYFIRFWLRTITLAEYHGYERLSVAFILMLSGFMYKMGLFFLHLEYVREKVTYSKNMPYIFTSWPLVIRQNTDIAYAHSYNLLWAALIFVELAAILLLLSMLLSFCLEDSDDSMEKTLNYKLSLPRYSTWDTSHPLPEEHEDEAEDDEEDEDAEELPPPPRKNMVYFNVD
ncbi:unnamed protein product [Echinostoma caproni]|uniref:Uncharacterized protein n=1 Tax=Echinostoma caproni TaxID=27848 RepID=A0A183A581_9TREM|nr:unnamed protein product [Echinostoma caproni]